MHPVEESLLLTRRHLLARTAPGLAALASLLGSESPAAGPPRREYANALSGLPHFKPRAKRIIYLFQSGAPSQLDLFDHKPGLKDRFAQNLPDSIRMGQRLTGMTATQ